MLIELERTTPGVKLRNGISTGKPANGRRGGAERYRPLKELVRDYTPAAVADICGIDRADLQ
ncbi:hypothetical protein QK344_30135, partial [Pseudomonas aeruginosa]|nr:hypothetical protein [Pseudomonas aeruginosa]